MLLEEIDRRVRVSISDNGQGITPEFLPHVFDRFRQADGTTTRAHGGLGLGLAIVRHLVEAHGGTVCGKPWDWSRLGLFLFPPLPALKRAREGEPENSSFELQRRNGAATSLRGVRVLVVDDDTDARQMISAVLSVQELR